MMTRMINLPWISHNLTVLESNDPSLVGVSGTVVEETKRTIIVRTESRVSLLQKTSSNSLLTLESRSLDP